MVDTGGASWGIINIVGPLLLAAVLLWALLRNRRSRTDVNRTEEGTRDVYDREEEARRRGDEDGA
jgi:hypothetical protein